MSVKPSLEAKLKGLEEEMEQKVRFQLRGVASDLVSYSPVWSGAYVSSHSFVPKGSGAGRRRVSKVENGPVNKQQARQDALQQLYADIERVDVFEGGVFRNRAKHALGVENGQPPARKRYSVYRNTAAKWK